MKSLLIIPFAVLHLILSIQQTGSCYSGHVAEFEQSLSDTLNLDLGPDPKVCIGAVFTLNENPIPGDYIWLGQGLSCNDCPSPEFTASSQGIFIITCILNTPCCSDTDVIRINVAPGFQPIVNILQDTVICQGEILSLGGAPSPGHTYSWSSDPAGFSSILSAPPIQAPQVSTIYYVDVTSPACIYPARDSVVVRVYEPPVLALNSSAQICLGDSVSLGNTMVDPDVSYSWSPNNGTLNDVTVANPVALPQSTGIHVYTITASNPGCTTIDFASVLVSDLQLTLNVPDTITICKGDSREIKVTVLPNGTLVSWSPLQNLQLSPDGLTGAVSPSSITTYTISSSIAGCSRSQTVTVLVDSLPDYLAVVPIDTNICLGTQVLLDKPVSQAPFDPTHFPDIQFAWEPSTGLLGTNDMYSVLVQPMDSMEYYRITTNGVCKDTVFASVNVIDPPDLTVSPDTSFLCFGESVQLSAMAIGFDSLIWTPGLGLTCQSCANPVATPESSTNFVLNAHYLGCVLSDTVFVEVQPLPLYEFPTPGMLCGGGTLQLNLEADTTGATYKWTSTPPFNIPSIDQPSVLLDVNGTQTIRFVMEADNGCVIRDSFSVQVTGVDLTLPAPDTICPENTKLLTAQASIGGGTYSWSTGATTQAINVSPLQTTTYTVSYLYNGCTFQDSVMITVQGQTPAIMFPADAALCPGDSIMLNSVETQGAVYTWTSNNGSFSSNEAIPDAFAPATSTTYTVTATAPDGCSITKSLPVTVFNASLSVSDDLVICSGEPFVLTATGTATGTYLWMPGSITTPTLRDTLFSAQTAEYTVLYTYGTAGNECYLEDTVNVTVLQGFTIKIVADPDSVVNAGEEIMLDAVVQPSQNQNGFTFEWVELGGDFQGNTQIVNVTAGSDSSVIYAVRVTSPNGCMATAQVQFRVIQSLVRVPNAFTPNGDSFNDVFRLAVVEGKATVESFFIYDRWGNKVFESFDPDASWDGTINGKEASSDVYVYRIRWRNSDGSLQVSSGDVTLLR
ncbi:MAG: gliding motility-associated C-terminal domain-containing protein [Lewinellaceae bacterium]|nr:gliding motility-associated C-terminal domain-containing protein [Saprospiraceae bacterium]MCB9342387.1 gliding motility-associated C-terminal domain-containing protein [Lewinellaceae bacterium]